MLSTQKTTIRQAGSTAAKHTIEAGDAQTPTPDYRLGLSKIQIKKGVLFYQYPSIRFIAIQLKVMLPAQSLKTFPFGYPNQQSVALFYTIPASILKLS